MRDTDRRGCVVSAISVRCARRSPGQYMRPVVPMRGGCLRGRYNDVINPTDEGRFVCEMETQGRWKSL